MSIPNLPVQCLFEELTTACEFIGIPRLQHSRIPFRIIHPPNPTNPIAFKIPYDSFRVVFVA